MFPSWAATTGSAMRLREIRPSFIAFLISFVVVANAWARHRDLFALIRHHRPVIWLNILYMLPLAILPFGTQLLARDNRDAVALEIYGLILVAIQLTRLAIWGYATGQPICSMPRCRNFALESRRRRHDPHRCLCGRDRHCRSIPNPQPRHLCAHPGYLFRRHLHRSTLADSGSAEQNLT